MLKAPKFKPGPSQSLTDEDLGAIQGVLNPDLFQAGLNALHTLSMLSEQDGRVVHHEVMMEVLKTWAFPCSALQVICNRCCPTHRDFQGGAENFDILATVGNYTGACFEVPTLGVRFAYEPGTIVVLLSYLLEHGVSEVQGDRITIAGFHRPDVHKQFMHTLDHNLPPPTIQYLQGLLRVPWHKRFC